MPRINLHRKKKLFNKNNDNKLNAKVYNSPFWKNLRLHYLMENPLCQMCLKDNKIKSGVEVHHILPISTGKTLFEKQRIAFDPDNLMSVCIEHHHKIHQKNNN